MIDREDSGRPIVLKASLPTQLSFFSPSPSKALQNKHFSRQMFWISFPILIKDSFLSAWEGRGGICPAALSLCSSLLPLGWDSLYFQAKGGVRWFTQPLPSRKPVSGFQLPFPVGGMLSSPPLPHPLPYSTHLSKIAATPISPKKLCFPALSGGNNASASEQTSFPGEICGQLEKLFTFLAKYHWNHSIKGNCSSAPVPKGSHVA